MKLYSILILLFFTSCYLSEELPPDQTTWDYDLPSNQNLDQEELLFLNNRIENEEFQVVEGMIIIRNEKLIFENYYLNASRSFRKNIGSGGLSITLAAIGIADDQRILSLSDPIATYLPEYEVIFTETPEKGDITIEDLLVHRSGLSWNESVRGYFDPVNNLNQMKETNDWLLFILNRPLEASPGLRFSYNTGAGIILAKIIENASGMTFDSYVQENLFDPLSITEVDLSQDPNGNYNGGDGYTINLLDWTKVGYLFLQEGIWNGRRILDPNFVQETITEQFQVSNSQSVGYIWTLFGNNFENQLGVDHEEVYYLSGALGEGLFIIPSENIVVSILADNFFGFNNLSLNLFAEITFLIR